MKILLRLLLRNHRVFNADPFQFPDHHNTTLSVQRSPDTGLISLSYAAVGGEIQDDEEEYMPSTSSWSCSSLRDEIIEKNEEPEDTASSVGVGGKMATPVDDASSKEVVLLSTSMKKKEDAAEKKRNKDSPPSDDCCPICFSEFSVPVTAPCGHWYCGGCIMQYWEYGPALQPCKCPMCSKKIYNLTPEASLSTNQEPEITQVLQKVQRYNRLFVGGLYGIIRKLLELPLFIKRMFHEMLNADRPNTHLNKLRVIAMLLGMLYMFSPVDFLRLGRLNVVNLFDDLAVIISFMLYIVGLILRRRRVQRAREMAAVEL